MTLVGTYSFNNFASWSTMSWSDLKAKLQSELSLRIVDPKDSPYAIVRYVKDQTKFTDPLANLCRSVIVEKATCRVVSLAPIRSLKESDELLQAESAVWRTESFLDGTMINVFYTPSTQSIVVATRSRVGACSSFDGKLSFDVQFNNALAAGNIDLAAIFQAFRPSSSDTSVFATFVLAHPDNRIVTPVPAAALSLVQMGYTDVSGVVNVVEDPNSWLLPSQFNSLLVKTWDLGSARTIQDITTWVQTTAKDLGFGWQGIVIKTGSGIRMRFRSDLYQAVRKLRGNENTLEERFARLRSTRTLQQYLTFYGEDANKFYEFEGVLRRKTRELLNLYISTFISKKQAYHELSWPFKYHVSVLHNMYKNTLKAKKLIVNQDVVIKYVNSLPSEDVGNLLKVQVAKPQTTDAQPAAEQLIVAGSVDLSGNDLSGNDV